MPDPVPPTADRQPKTDFYSGAYARILRFMLVAGIAAALAILVRWGWVVAAGFLLGGAVSFVNFYWLKGVVAALADRVTATGAPQSSKGIVARFLLRYFLIALGAYVIFKISSASLYGLLAGLFLPVAGIFCEAIYETYAGVRRRA